MHPWADYDQNAGLKPRSLTWNHETHPYFVRWTVIRHDTRNMDRNASIHVRYFKTSKEAKTAFERPFSGVSVEIVARATTINGGLNPISIGKRQCNGQTRWNTLAVQMNVG